MSVLRFSEWSQGSAVLDEAVRVSVSITREDHKDTQVVDNLGNCLRRFGYNDRELVAVQTALLEAFSNAWAHGGTGSARDNVSIAYVVSEDACTICVSDSGPGFDPSTLPDPTSPEHFDQVCAGRGLLIMRHFMSNVEILAPGNCVKLILRRGERWTDQV